MRVEEGDVGGERVNELVLSHERFVREFRVWNRHFWGWERGEKNGGEKMRGNFGFVVEYRGFWGSETGFEFYRVDRRPVVFPGVQTV